MVVCVRDANGGATMSTVSRRRLDLPVEGMTCASCAARVERRLSRLDGVSASVNYATERATVTFDPSDHDLAEIAAAIEQAGYHAVLPAKREEQGDQRHDAAMLRMAVAVVLAVPVAAISMVSSLQFDGWQWLALALTTPVVLWAGWPFHRVAPRNGRHGTPPMDTLVSLGTLTAYLWSLYALTLGDAGELSYRMPWEWTTGVRQQGAEHIYLEVAAVVTALILVGRAMEARAKRHAGAALRSLLELGAKDVATLRDGTERRVPIAELRSGDLFAVRPGETVATDGVVVDGRSAVDASLLTGESTPVEVGPGDGVTGGSVNQGGALTVRATAVGADTALARIARLVAEAQSGKAPSQRLADQVSAIFVPLVIALSAATLGFWIADGADASFAVEAAAAVLIVACPCALGLATPTALLVGTGRGAQLGVVIRGPEVLEQSRRITAVVLDKTGTLTEGRMSVSGVDPAAGASRADVLRLAGAVAHASEHPVARAIAEQARREIGELPAAGDVRQTPGLGVQALVEGRRIAVGRGNGATAVTADGNPVGSIRLEDRIAR